MKVHIRPYPNWVGPYQIAGVLKYIGVSEDRCFAIGTWLHNTPLNDICEFIHEHREKRESIRIDPYDTWSMDRTLASIILPMLKQLKDAKQGAGNVDDEDVPEHLRSTAAPPKESEWDVDENHFKRSEYIFDQMIWTFEQLQPDYTWEDVYWSGEHDIIFKENAEGMTEMTKGPSHTHKVDEEGLNKHQEQINNGLRLFGKYYLSLWD